MRQSSYFSVRQLPANYGFLPLHPPTLSFCLTLCPLSFSPCLTRIVLYISLSALSLSHIVLSLIVSSLSQSLSYHSLFTLSLSHHSPAPISLSLLSQVSLPSLYYFSTSLLSMFLLHSQSHIFPCLLSHSISTVESTLCLSLSLSLMCRLAGERTF